MQALASPQLQALLARRAALAGSRTTPGACGRRTSSSAASRALQPRQRQRQRQQVAAHAAAPREAAGEPQLDVYGEPIGSDEIGFTGVPGEDFVLERGIPDGIEGRGGYTPYDLIDFTDIPLKHEVVARVERPISEVYALWADRLNWPEWFHMIEEVGFKEGEEDMCALNMWYRFAMTPWLELFVALRRTQAQPNKFIVEEPQDGAPLVAAALFQEDGPDATLVTLRVSYLLPRVLFEYAGTMAVYGDVDRKLQRCMGRMQEWVEACDFGARQRWGREQMAGIREALPEDKRKVDAAEAQFQEEKARLRQQQQRQQQQAAAAAAAEAAAAAAQPPAGAPAGEAEGAAPVAAAEQAPAAAPAAKSKRGRKAGGASAASAKGKKGRKQGES